MTTTSNFEVIPDKAGTTRDGCMEAFWTVEQFAQMADVSERQVRFYIAECGMPCHGQAKKGPNKLRLGQSALLWLRDVYRPQSRYERALRNAELPLGIDCAYLTEAQAYARLYDAPIPYDPELEGPDAAEERRQWKTFKEIRPTTWTAKHRQWESINDVPQATWATR